MQLSYQQFSPVYAGLVSFACCEALNWVGAMWTALLVAGCCLVVLAGLAMWWVARMDQLEPRACWHIYRVRDYEHMEEEEEEEGEEGAVPELPDKPCTTQTEVRPGAGGHCLDGLGGPLLAACRQL